LFGLPWPAADTEPDEPSASFHQREDKSMCDSPTAVVRLIRAWSTAHPEASLAETDLLRLPALLTDPVALSGVLRPYVGAI